MYLLVPTSIRGGPIVTSVRNALCVSIRDLAALLTEVFNE